MTVPRATIPTLEEMALPLEVRLRSLWVRDAGGVREQFGSFEDFSRRFGGSENPVAEAAVSLETHRKARELFRDAPANGSLFGTEQRVAETERMGG